MNKSAGQWMPIYWSDYFGKTTHLTTEEHGVYLLLIGAYWQRGSPLPDDDKFLSTASRLSQKRWRMVRRKISEFFAISEGVWRHERVEKEILRSCARIASASANAHARWMRPVMLPTSTPPEESKKELLNGFVVGKKNGAGNGHVTIQDSDERLARFQKWLAQDPGKLGWLIVTRAADPHHPEFSASIELCKARAKVLGKGWPRQWPTA